MIIVKDVLIQKDATGGPTALLRDRFRVAANLISRFGVCVFIRGGDSAADLAPQCKLTFRKESGESLGDWDFDGEIWDGPANTLIYTTATGLIGERPCPVWRTVETELGFMDGVSGYVKSEACISDSVHFRRYAVSSDGAALTNVHVDHFLRLYPVPVGTQIIELGLILNPITGAQTVNVPAGCSLDAFIALVAM